MAVDHPREGTAPSPVICRHRLSEEISFSIAVDPAAAAGGGGHPADPISKMYLDGSPNLNASMLNLMLGFVKPGSVVLDLGTHIGSFALTAAARGCRVIAVEASPTNAALVRASVQANNWNDRVTLIHAAVSDRDGELSFTAYGPWGHVTTPVRDFPSVKVAARRVDDLLAAAGCDRVDFIKIDVEGSEPPALEGARKLLERADAPPILYESNYVPLDFYGRTPRTLRAVLAGLGYTHHYIVKPGRLIAAGPDDFQGEIVGDYLAAKGPLSPPPGWRVEAGMARAELVRMIKANCGATNRKVLLGRALRGAPADLLADESLRELLVSLKSDPAAEVREAVRWFEKGPREGFFQRLLGKFTGRGARTGAA